MTPIQRKIRILNLQDAIKAMRRLGTISDPLKQVEITDAITAMEDELNQLKNGGFVQGYVNCDHDMKVLRHSVDGSLLKCTKCPFMKFENY